MCQPVMVSRCKRLPPLAESELNGQPELNLRVSYQGADILDC